MLYLRIMNIEQEIKQTKPFENSHQKAMVNLIYTSNHIKAKVNKHLKQYGITSKQYNVLRILKGAGKPISTSAIKQRLIDRMSDASRIVDRLVQKNLVERVTCGNDRRLVDVTLSQDGLLLLNNIQDKKEDLNNLLKNLSAKEANQLSGLLDKLRG